MLRAYITGVAGPTLSAQERALLSHCPPCGLILFARNCIALDQIRTLVRDACDAAGADLLVLIDQEGGRVQRLRPPLGRALPSARVLADLYEDDRAAAEDAAFAISRLVAHDLKILGINTNCTPVLDIPVAGADDIIGDRAFGSTPDKVARLARAVANGYLAGGVLPVIKHIPGHGRATVDSHLALPVVDTNLQTLEASDFVPFKALADLPLAMSAHVIFTALDRERPASISPAVTKTIIREWMGFDGLLMSDDVSMKALTGAIEDRARAVLGAGSDVVLHCNGDLDEMRDIALVAPELAGDALRRYKRAIGHINHSEPFDHEAAEKALIGLLETSGSGSESV